MEQSTDEIIAFIRNAKRKDYFEVARRFAYSKKFSLEKQGNIGEAIVEFFIQEFGPEIKHYFERSWSEYNFVINLSIWSFLARDNFRRVQLQAGNNNDKQKAQAKAFEPLGLASKHYSTITEFVANGIQSAFYFDPDVTKQGSMKIYEVDVNGRKWLKPVTIDGTHRKDIEPKNRFSFTKLEQYTTARKDGAFTYEDEDTKKEKLTEEQQEKEIAYQNQVIRWYIRVGLFNPLNVKVYTDAENPKNLGNSEENLLAKKNKNNSNLLEKYTTIIEEQFHKSVKKNNTYSPEDDMALDEVIDWIATEFPQHIAARVFTFDTGFFDLLQYNTSISDIYWVPLLTGKKDQSAGGVQYINVDKPLHKDEDKDDLLYTISSLTHLFSGQFDDSQMQEIDYIHNKNINAAGISIMSRNISHNIGSHTLSYEKNNLMNISSMLNNGALEGLLKQEGNDFYIDKNFLALEESKERYRLRYNEKGFELEYLKAVGFFLGYLQERMDYISVVASGKQYYYGKVHLWEDIILYFLRKDKNTLQGKTLLIPTERNILLERIIFAENYGKEDIEIHYKNNTSEDVCFSLPTGVIGRQGIFAILENIIRNTSKHGCFKQERGGKLIIKIVVENANEDYYKLSIIDNSGCITNEQMQTIQNSIESSLLINGRINERQKGIKEMQVAAAWLRGIASQNIKDADSTNDLKVLSIKKHLENNKDIGLQFDLYIKKAREVLLVSNEKYTDYKLPSSWEQVNWEQLKTTLTTRQYNFVLFDKQMSPYCCSPEIALKKGYSLPVRSFIYDFSTIDFNQLNGIAGIEATIYTKWLEHMDKRIIPSSSISTQQLKIGIIHKNITLSNSSSEVTLVRSEGKLNVDRRHHIIYRNHNDSDSKFKEFQQGNFYDKAIFIEGISGNNSTYRLALEEEKTSYWTRKIQESAACRVMLIDERIWNKTMPTKTTDTRAYSVALELGYSKAEKKQLFIYDIKFNEDIVDKKVQLINLRKKPEAIICKDGRVKWLGKHPSFHFVSFHQGLLDKVYNYFGILNEDKANFFDNLQASTGSILRYYLHSGRSITPDLPKGAGFIPLAALDAALCDCKFRLVELLFSAVLNENK